MSQDPSRLSQHLKKAMITMQLTGCSGEEASSITGVSKRHLLRLHRDGDTRIISYQVGREVIFDKPNLIRMRDSFSPKKPTTH
uniref:Helix-turn-helix protein n=1 Tax=Vibrio crassostreae TaxID=246167 RepID=A0A0H3ZTE9_9VIBR|nr:hypothetical protein [Vibrio crassostreae]